MIVVQTVVLVIAAAALAVVPYRVGNGTWTPTWARTTRDLGLFTLMAFVTWYVLYLIVGGPAALIPAALIFFCVVAALGWRSGMVRTIKWKRSNDDENRL